MTDYRAIIDHFYSREPILKELLLTHSENVARKALDCAGNYERRTGETPDRRFILEAAMLHDIGIIACDAPGIYCFGSRPYICHGTEGRTMLESLGLKRHALVCERHTGAGLTVEVIERQHLPLPRRDMTPRSVEEKIICYADKFFSKSGDPTREKSFERAEASMRRHGPDTLSRFLAMHALFGTD